MIARTDRTARAGEAVKIERLYATDDSCQIMFYVRCHVDPAAFRAAVADVIRDEHRAIVLTGGEQIRHVFYRTVPIAGNIVCDSQMVESAPGRGAWPATIMDEWFPCHAYLPAPPTAGETT